MRLCVHRVYIQRLEHDEAVMHCSEVLRDDPNHTKALARRAKAFLLMNNTDAAEKDVARLTERVPAADSQVKLLVQMLKRQKVRFMVSFRCFHYCGQ